MIDPAGVQAVEIGALFALADQVAGGGEVFQVPRHGRLAELKLRYYIRRAHLALPGQQRRRVSSASAFRRTSSSERLNAGSECRAGWLRPQLDTVADDALARD